MPLNTSGPISIGGSTTGQSINLELGRAATASSNLNETALRNLAGKASGIIKLSDFYGKSNLAASLPDEGQTSGWIELLWLFYDLYVWYGEAFVDIILNSNGTGAYRYGDINTPATNIASFTWKTGGGSAGDYYAHMAAPTGDSFTAGYSATGTALSLSTTRQWVLLSTNSVNPSTAGKYLTSTLQIRRADGSALVSKNVSMDASVTLGGL